MSRQVLASEQRAAILDREIAAYIRRGYTLLARSETGARLFKPKRFQPWLVVLSALCFGIGLLIYLIIYLLTPEEPATIEVDPYGVVARYGRARASSFSWGRLATAIVILGGIVLPGIYLTARFLRGDLAEPLTFVHVCPVADFSVQTQLCLKRDSTIRMQDYAEAKLAFGADIVDLSAGNRLYVDVSRNDSSGAYSTIGHASLVLSSPRVGVYTNLSTIFQSLGSTPIPGSVYHLYVGEVSSQGASTNRGGVSITLLP